VNSIAAASEQQSAAVEEVSSSIDTITTAFQGSRDAVGKINQSTVELAQVSSDLMQLVAWFNITAQDEKKRQSGDKKGYSANSLAAG
jgi:methyl-accepting chemotaxis protein